jgi:hypothetical protein
LPAYRRFCPFVHEADLLEAWCQLTIGGVLLSTPTLNPARRSPSLHIT